MRYVGGEEDKELNLWIGAALVARAQPQAGDPGKGGTERASERRLS